MPGGRARRRERRERAASRAEEARRQRDANRRLAPLGHYIQRPSYEERNQHYLYFDGLELHHFLPMAYIAPIHRASSVRNAIKLNFLDPEEECLAVAKASRLEIYAQTPNGLSLRHAKNIFGQIVIMEKLRPESSATDHLFICTERQCFFTLSWDPESQQLKTERSYVDLTEKSGRDAQTNNRCFVDPRRRFLTLSLYEGIYTVLIVQWKSQGKGQKQVEVGSLANDVIPVRIPEIMIRSSTYLNYRNPTDEKEAPRIATLYQNNHDQTLLKVRKLTVTKNQEYIELEDPNMLLTDKLEPTATHLIPVPNPVNGLLVIAETCVTWVNDENGVSLVHPMDEATIWATWTEVDANRWLLSDEYGYLYFLNLIFDQDDQEVKGFKMDKLGRTSRATCLVYLDAGRVFVGSHWGDSHVIQIVPEGFEVLQSFTNIGPILDLTIMDMGSRGGEGQLNEYSSGQARIVTGSGAFSDGSLRSIRSGVGIEEIGSLDLNPGGGAVPKAASNMFHLAIPVGQATEDLLLVSYVDETRIFHFSQDGSVEEIQQMITNEPTILADKIVGSQLRFIQCTNRSVTIYTPEAGQFRLIAHWQLPGSDNIVAASISQKHVVLSLGGSELVTLDITESTTQGSGLKELARRKVDELISCIDSPMLMPEHLLVGYWQSTSLSILSLPDLKDVHSTQISDDPSAVPRSVLLTQVLPNTPPTLFLSLADGHVVTFDVDTRSFKLSNRQTTILGSQQATLKILPRRDDLFSVFAIAEHSTLIYGSENRLVYSAVTADEATCICSFDSAAYPEAVALATPSELKIASVERERTTHVETLPVGETVRRIAYSPELRLFGMGTIRRTLIDAVEMVQSHFRLADEISFHFLSEYAMNEEEIIESVCRVPLEENYVTLERFAVGTSYLAEEEDAEHPRGRLLLFEVTEERELKLVTEVKLKGACRAIAALDDRRIVAALVKTLVVFEYEESSLKKTCAYRCATAPIDIFVHEDYIAVSDLMKSVAIVKFTPGNRGSSDKLEETARHYSLCWSTAISRISEKTILESDAESNMVLLTQNRTFGGPDPDANKRLETICEMHLGEMVNKIKPVKLPNTDKAIVDPRAFLGTVSGGIYMFGVINGDKADELLTLQNVILKHVQSPGNIPWALYRAAKSSVRDEKEPLRFVDSDVVEAFLDCDKETQEQVVNEWKQSNLRRSSPEIGGTIEQVRASMEKLRRMH